MITKPHPSMRFYSVLILTLIIGTAQSQNNLTAIDSLVALLPTMKEDTIRVEVLVNLSNLTRNTDLARSLRYGREAIGLAHEVGNPNTLRKSYQSQGISYMYGGNGDSSLWAYREAMVYAERMNKPSHISNIYMNMGITYGFVMFDHQASLESLYKALAIADEHDLNKASILGSIASSFRGIGNNKQASHFDSLAIVEADRRNESINTKMLLKGNYASSLFKLGRQIEGRKILMECIEYRTKTNDKFFLSNHYVALGNSYLGENNWKAAIPAFNEALRLKKEVGTGLDIASLYVHLGEIEYYNTRNFVLAKQHFLKAFHIADSLQLLESIYNSSKMLQKIAIYHHDLDLASHYDSIEVSATKTMDKEAQTRAVTELTAKYETEKKEKENEVLRLTRTSQRYTIMLVVVVLVAVIVLLIVVYRSRQLFKRTNELLRRKNQAIERQHAEITEQKHHLDIKIDELKTTQAQLLQSEKMASLGQMTSGIAHEINNPLTFISGGVQGLQYTITELVERARLAPGGATPIGELETQATGLVTSIVNGVQRANKIVTSLRTFSSPQGSAFSSVRITETIDVALTMLNHKVTERGIKISIDYQDTRPVLGNASELSQVFSNLLDNAIHAVEDAEDRRVIAIRTEAAGDHVVVSITDSGRGIPEGIQNRIFEPFFTTKEVGKGTGLGLPISYAIVEKHQGKMTFSNVTSGGAEFKVSLKVN